MEIEKEGIKELYDVSIRLNSPLDLDGRHYDINEAILTFDRAQIAQVQQSKTSKEARGGFNNNLLIEWERDREVGFSITKGTVSMVTWALLSNSKINEACYRSIPYKEELTVIDDGDTWFADLKYIPNHVDGKWGIQGNPDNEPLPMGRREWLPLKPLPPQKDRFLFCYDTETGKRIMNFDVCGNRIVLKNDHKKITVDYTFDYDDKVRILSVGNRLFEGFMNLTAKVTIKDYWSGKPVTAILEIPKIKIRSDLVMMLGSGENEPVVSDFFFTGYPGEGRLESDQEVWRIVRLDEELTGEYE